MSSAIEETTPLLNKLHKMPIHCKLGEDIEKLILHSVQGERVNHYKDKNKNLGIPVAIWYQTVGYCTIEYS